MERHEKPSKISGHEKTLKPLRFQGFLMISTRDQRLLNCGARRAALRPYCAGPQTRIHCGATVSEFKSVSHRKFNLKQCAVSLRPVARLSSLSLSCEHIVASHIVNVSFKMGIV